MNIHYKTNYEIEVEDIIEIFKSVGWNKSSDDIIEAFSNSYYITAYYKNNLIGFARAISDGHYYTSIFDVIVKPEFQKRGIAKSMLKILLKKFKGSYFFLSYTPGNKEFYEKCGFEELNSAMWIDKGRSVELDIESL